MGHELHSSSNDIANLVVAPLTDYHLKTNSPAIDTGQTVVSVPADLENLARPAGSSSDIGAYEFGAVLAAPLVTVTLVGADERNRHQGCGEDGAKLVRANVAARPRRPCQVFKIGRYAHHCLAGIDRGRICLQVIIGQWR